MSPIGRIARLPMLLAVAMAPAFAGAQQESNAQTVFTPTLFVVASHSNNEYRTALQPVGDSSLYTELELPFVFRGPRWNGGFSINPAWRQYQELEQLEQLETSLSGWARGALSRRTSLRLVAAGVYSPQLTGLDGADIIAPRARRLRSRGLLGVRHSLNAAGDALDFEAEYDSLQYLDDDFVSERSYGLQTTFDKAVGKRLLASVAGRVDRIEYANSGWVNTVTPLLGFDYRLAPRTDLTVRGGVSFSQRGGLVVTEAGAASSTDGDLRNTVAFLGRLRHRGEHTALSLEATRQIGSGVALGEPTIRSQLTGSWGYQQARFRLGLTAGVAFNELFDGDGTAVLLTEDGLATTTATEVRTFASCLDAAYRVSEWMSLVAAGRVGRQLPTGAPEALELDVYRVSLGVALHPNAPRAGSAAGVEVLDRYGRAGSIGSC